MSRPPSRLAPSPKSLFRMNHKHTGNLAAKSFPSASDVAVAGSTAFEWLLLLHYFLRVESILLDSSPHGDG